MFCENPVRKLTFFRKAIKLASRRTPPRTVNIIASPIYAHVSAVGPGRTIDTFGIATFNMRCLMFNHCLNCPTWIPNR